LNPTELIPSNRSRLFSCVVSVSLLLLLETLPQTSQTSAGENAAESSTNSAAISAMPTESTSTTAEKPAVEVLSPEAAQALHQVYDYDRTIPLEARIVERIEKEGTVREKVVFRGVQGFLVPGYLEMPAEKTSPRPCVLLLHGWSGSKDHFWKDGGYISGGEVRRSLLAAGYAVLALDAQCHGDRIAANDFAPVNHYRDPDVEGLQRKGYFSQQEIYIQTTRDYRRAIDYLESRTDIDTTRIGMLGYSMGGAQTFLLTGVDPRIRAAVSCCAPADTSRFSPIAPQNFTAAIGDRPFLMIMGRTDTMCPVPSAQGVLDLIPSTRKQLVFLEAGHRLPADYVPQAIEWLREHLK
jgi:dienelactone hydrolase